MKRRTRQNVGAFPNMRDDTLKAIADELIRARQKHSSRDGNLEMLNLCMSVLSSEITTYEAGNTFNSTASQLYARYAMIAAMAIRCMEEGWYKSRYAGNTAAPKFELEA